MLNSTESSPDLALATVMAALDEALAFLNAGEVAAALATANDAIALATRELDTVGTGLISRHARDHAFANAVMADPLTSHSFARPRGYPGDARLLDLIYRHHSVTALIDGASSLGAAIFQFTSEVAPSRAVRQRRIDVAGLIDEITLRRPAARILSVACGHLREAELSSAVKDGAVGRLVAFDQDAESLAIAGSYGSFVEPRRGNVRELLRSQDHEEFDLVYAAGLFDYLDQRTAARLTARLFERLRPGGELIVPNFRTGIWEAPYLSVFMDWQLIYRTEAEIAAFATELPTSLVAESAVTIDATGCIGTLRVRRG